MRDFFQLARRNAKGAQGIQERREIGRPLKPLRRGFNAVKIRPKAYGVLAAKAEKMHNMRGRIQNGGPAVGAQKRRIKIDADEPFFVDDRPRLFVGQIAAVRTERIGAAVAGHQRIAKGANIPKTVLIQMRNIDRAVVRPYDGDCFPAKGL